MDPTLDTLTTPAAVPWAELASQQQQWLVAIAVIGGAVVVLQLAIAVWTAHRLRELTAMRERTSRLFDTMALLTDTTEAGLATVIGEVERLARRPAATRRTGRSSTARRVVEAAEEGTNVAAIAERESLSEGEVHLHLRLADAARKAAASSPAAGA